MRLYLVYFIYQDYEHNGEPVERELIGKYDSRTTAIAVAQACQKVYDEVNDLSPAQPEDYKFHVFCGEREVQF